MGGPLPAKPRLLQRLIGKSHAQPKPATAPAPDVAKAMRREERKRDRLRAQRYAEMRALALSGAAA